MHRTAHGMLLPSRHQLEDTVSSRILYASLAVGDMVCFDPI